jgi:hypothetical protein
MANSNSRIDAAALGYLLFQLAPVFRAFRIAAADLVEHGIQRSGQNGQFVVCLYLDALVRSHASGRSVGQWWRSPGWERRLHDEPGLP